MDFPKTITLRDKKTETLLTVQDFEYLVDKYMGFEALRFSETCGKRPKLDSVSWRETTVISEMRFTIFEGSCERRV